GDRDALRDLGMEPAAVRDLLQRAGDERVAVEPFDADVGRALDREMVAEGDALVNGDELMPAVRSSGPDDQGEVDLRGRGRALHRSSRGRSRNSAGVSSSARTSGIRAVLVLTPESSSEFASFLRRCANAASTIRLTCRKSSGNPVRRKATTAD